jgi:tetratricopeptide (TPR) repeat protein
MSISNQTPLIEDTRDWATDLATLLAPPHPLTIFCGAPSGGGSQASDLLWQVIESVAPNPLRIGEVGAGFESFSGIHAVLAAVLPIAEKEAPELVEQRMTALEDMSSAPRLLKHMGVSHVAESITFAITRRIGRESHHSALIIDRLARAMLETMRRCPSFRGGTTLFIPDLERWDRPSLRWLYRVALLAGPGDRLSAIAASAGPASTDDDFGADAENAPLDEDRITWARSRFFARLYDLPAVRVRPAVPHGLPTGADDHGQDWGEAVLPEHFKDLLLTIGEALSYQNYERVYQLAYQTLAKARDPEQEAQTRRLIGIAHAQLEDFGSAEREISRAAALTADRAFGAHLEYLIGLIATKRVYNMDLALRHYQRGLDVLGPGPDRSAERRVERAWLLNGQALVMTLKAKQGSSGEDRDEKFKQAFAQEFEAFDLVKDLPGAAPSYLRHNLLANLTFLLEISQRFEEAVTFWRRAFERYLAADSHAFEATFNTRLGLLLFKAGRREEGIATLERARELCAGEGDGFLEESVCLATGYAYAKSGQHDRALRAYLAGRELSWRLRSLDSVCAHQAGILCCLAAMRAIDEFDQVRQQVLESLPGTVLAARLAAAAPDGSESDPGQFLTAAGIVLPLPSPKLPAYIPEVDLEGIPAQDLNRYLVWSSGPFGPGRGGGRS